MIDSIYNLLQQRISFFILLLGEKPEPACMDILSDLAQVCARFTELTKEGDGLRGCTVLEPTLLGDVQARYPVACFNMGPSGMSLDESRQPTVRYVEKRGFRFYMKRD